MHFLLSNLRFFVKSKKSLAAFCEVEAEVVKTGV